MFGKLTKKLKGLGDKSRSGGTHVAVFGKHPGWADHMDEIGLATEDLVELRQLLYTEGIGRNIDLGTWEKLAPEARLETFDHVFLYRAESGNVIGGRFWSSTDGRGRSKYPMLVCLQCGASKRSWLMFSGLAELARAQQRFVSAETADEVRSRYQELCERVVPAGVGAADDRELTHVQALRELFDSGIGDGSEQLLRTVYGIERELGVHLGEGAVGSSIQSSPRAGSVRVPRGPGGAAECILRWSSVLDPVVPRRQSLMLVSASGCDWVDVLVGRPGPESMVCLRTDSSALPPVSAIPYTIDPALRHRFEGYLPADSV